MIEFNIGDTVLLKCKVIGKGIMVYTEEVIIDIVPMCRTEQKPYTMYKPWSVFGNDVVKEQYD